MNKIEELKQTKRLVEEAKAAFLDLSPEDQKKVDKKRLLDPKDPYPFVEESEV